MVGQRAKEGADFGARDGIDATNGTCDFLQRGEHAFVFFTDGESGSQAADGVVERLRRGFVVAACLEDDADGIFREAFPELEGEKDGEFDLGSA